MKVMYGFCHPRILDKFLSNALDVLKIHRLPGKNSIPVKISSNPFSTGNPPHPAWWHSHGFIIPRIRKENQQVNFEYELEKEKRIIRRITIKKEKTVNVFSINYEIDANESSTYYGSITASYKTIEAMFGFKKWNEDSGTELLSKFCHDPDNPFETDKCASNVFIRYKEFLNIPGPSWGHHTDPAISIMVNEEIKSAIRWLMKS